MNYTDGCKSDGLHPLLSSLNRQNRQVELLSLKVFETLSQELSTKNAESHRHPKDPLFSREIGKRNLLKLEAIQLPAGSGTFLSYRRRR